MGTGKGPALTALLEDLLQGDLSFRGENTAYATHALHPFPAKFPPQLPRLFIERLTEPGQVVLDPMVGSGTTLVEAMLLGRRGVGVDIDPLAVLLSRAKTTPLERSALQEAVDRVLESARRRLADPSSLSALYTARYPEPARRFFAYWFPPQTRLELCALADALERLEEPRLRTLLRAVLSSTIIAKSGGVSLARDLAHSRPHRDPSKQVRSALDLFAERAQRLLPVLPVGAPSPAVLRGDARALPLRDRSVDLVLTSPPYATAIDYLRVSKFSLLWLGYPPSCLAGLRRAYVGGRSAGGEGALGSPLARRVLALLEERDPPQARALGRYFRQMQACLGEMRRVLRPGAPAVVVVGPSRARGVLIPTPEVLADLAREVGFRVVGIGWRSLDRDRRALPVGRGSPREEGIEARIHREGVLALLG